jgi:hypothetical protein
MFPFGIAATGSHPNYMMPGQTTVIVERPTWSKCWAESATMEHTKWPSASGSQRRIQWVVNNSPELLDGPIGVGPIDWRSPIASDKYAEYCDDAFLNRLGVTLSKRSLESFLPRVGPQWDALGRAESGEIVLVEAMAHLNELYSPVTVASESSLARIQQSLREAAFGLGVPNGFDWSKQFYQYTNRLAHAYLLDVINGNPTRLAFVHFIGDADVDGPPTRIEWETAIAVVHDAIGLSEVPRFVVDIFIDVREHMPIIQ